MKFKLRTRKSGKNHSKWLQKLERGVHWRELEKCGEMGVEALSANTPFRTGLTASSWYYKIEKNSKGVSLAWYNSNILRNGVPLAIILQYGHGTGTGGYVIGRDYINPAMASVFGEIEDRVWKVVTSDE